MNGLNKASDLSLDASSLDPDLNNVNHCLRLADRRWKSIHQSKHDLVKLWNGNRTRNGLQPTEIRVVARRKSSRSSGSAYEFHGQAENFDLARIDAAEGLSRGSETTNASNVGIWADPDVFSLAETQPWLGYRQLPEFGCCCWHGDLPRDSNPNEIPSKADGEIKRTISPPLIKLDLEALDEQTLESFKRDSNKRRAREDENTDEDNAKRQRTGSILTQDSDGFTF